MEPIELLLQLTCCLLEFVDVAAVIANIVAFVKSGPNRQARRLAKTTGAELPPRDGWFQFLIFITPIAITLTFISVYKWVVWARG